MKRSARAGRRLAGAVVLGGLLAASGCVRDKSAAEIPPKADIRSLGDRGAVVRFSFETIDNKTLSTQSVAGRLSVIGFVTTYDFASQAEARHLSAVLRRHTPRVNVGLLVLEQPENRPLVEAFVATLGLQYPVALADDATIAGQGPFANLHHVPSVVILDKDGREAWRHLGLVDERDIHQALRTLEAAEPRPRTAEPTKHERPETEVSGRAHRTRSLWSARNRYRLRPGPDVTGA